jgi:hypothetical protein
MSQVTVLYYTAPGHKSAKFSGGSTGFVETLSGMLYLTGAEAGGYEYAYTAMEKLCVDVFMAIVGLPRYWGKFNIGSCGRATEAADEGLACDLLREPHDALVLSRHVS